MEQSDVFVSYRRKDVDFVKRLDQALKDSGREVWVDWEDIPPGVEGFADEIQRGIEGADAFIAVLSPSYLESEYCLMELREALRLKKRIVPVIYQKFDPAPPPEGIGHINWVYFTPHAGQENTFEQSFPKVTEALEADYEYTRQHTRILLRAIDWDKNQRNNSYLMKGAEIEKAEQWQMQAAGKDLAPTELQTDLILTSRKQQRRQQRQFMAVIGGLLVVAVIAAIYAVFKAHEANINAEFAYSNALASAALQPGNEEIAVALALEATRSEHASPDVFKTLAEAAYPSGGIRYILEPDPEQEYYDYRYPAVSPDGELVAIKDRLYELSTGKLLRTFKDTPGYVLAGLFTPDGKRVVLAGDDDGVLDPDADPVLMGLYDVESGELLQKFDTGIGVMDIQLSTDDSTLVGVQPDGKAVWWDMSSGQKLREFAYEGKLVFSPDLRWMAELRQTSDPLLLELSILDTGTMEIQATTEIMIDDGAYFDEAVMRFTPDSEWITVSAQTLDTYEAESGELVSYFSDPPSGIVSIRYSPDGAYLVLASSTHGVTLWDQYGYLVAEQKAHRSWATFADFARDGERVLSTDLSGTVIAWDVMPGNVNQRLASMDFESPVGITPDGRYLVTHAATNDNRDHYILVRDGNTMQELSRAPLPGGDLLVPPVVAYLGDGLEQGLIAYQTSTNWGEEYPTAEVHVASLSSGDVLASMSINGIATPAFLPDGEALMVTYFGSDELYHLEIRAALTGDILYESAGWDTVVLSPDGALMWLARGEYDEEDDELVSRPTEMIDLRTMETLFSLDDPYTDTVFFAPGGAQFAAVSSNTFGGSIQHISLREVSTGEPLHEISIHTQSGTFLFHPDGTSFFTAVPQGGGGGGATFPSGIIVPLSAENTGSVKQWDLETGSLIWDFPAQTGDILVTPDGSRLLTGDSEGLRTWRLDGPEQLVEWVCANRYVPVFTPEQRFMYSIESDSSICNHR